MRKHLSLCLSVALLLVALGAPARAGVNIERQGTENPMVEIFKSTIYGALAGAVVGGAIALAVQDEDSTDEILRWSIVSGTMVGLGAGIYFVARRPQPSGLLELDEGRLGLNPALPTLEPGGGMAWRLVAVRF